MVGASPDNIGAQRLAEGGVPASGAGSADSQKVAGQGRLSQSGSESMRTKKNWNLTPITSTA
jgi:hypothetical protein